MATPLINGESYAWAQIVCTVLNVPIVGITEISYKEMQEKKDNYGQGKYPVSRGYGKIETEGSITLLLYTWRKWKPFAESLPMAGFWIFHLFRLW